MGFYFISILNHLYYFLSEHTFAKNFKSLVHLQHEIDIHGHILRFYFPSQSVFIKICHVVSFTLIFLLDSRKINILIENM